jgi:hypothetical protein
VSLGSSKGNHAVEAEILGETFSIERIGTDGDVSKAAQMIRELDGKADAIGLGGTDLYLVAGGRKYVIKESQRLAANAKTTPVVDGSGLKDTLERETIRWLTQHGFELKDKNALMVIAVDRFGMAEALIEAGCHTIFGDLMFSLGIPIPMRSMNAVRVLGRLALPILCHLPIRMLYPTGKSQEEIKPKYEKYYQWADIIAGDFHPIRKHLPPAERHEVRSLQGKMIVTNTTTADDVQRLRERGVATLVTTTPKMNGRSFGTNVMEGVFITLANKQPEEMMAEDYLALMQRMGWQPRVEKLNDR